MHPEPRESLSFPFLRRSARLDEPIAGRFWIWIVVAGNFVQDSTTAFMLGLLKREDIRQLDSAMPTGLCVWDLLLFQQPNQSWS